MRYINKYMHAISPYRGLLLLWIGVVYVWGIRWGEIIKEQITGDSVFLFTLLMLLHTGLYGASRFLTRAPHWLRYLYIPGQILLITLISLVAHRLTVTTALYLTLVGEMANLIVSIPLAILAGFVCLLFLCINTALLHGQDTIPSIPRLLIPLPIAALLYILPLFLLVFGYTQLFTRQLRAHAETRRLLEELEQAHRELEKNAVRLGELTRAAERQRMARELHDTLAQGLAGLILQLEAVKAHLLARHEERALEIVIQAMGRARTSLADARTVISDLRTETQAPITDLSHTLTEEIERFTAATGITCNTELSCTTPLPEELGEAIVRSVNEGLLNIARHAQASEIWIRVEQSDQDNIEVEVQDNGIGFDANTISRPGHYGLLGLRERARLLGGQFTLNTQPGKGTTIHLLLPVTTREGFFL